MAIVSLPPPFTNLILPLKLPDIFAWMGIPPYHRLLVDLTQNQMKVKKMTMMATVMATATVKKVVLLYLLPHQPAILSSLVTTITSMMTAMAVLFVAQSTGGQWIIPFLNVFAT